MNEWTLDELTDGLWIADVDYARQLAIEAEEIRRARESAKR